MGPAEWPTKCISSGCKAACTDHNLIFCITKLFKRSLICKDVQLYQVRLVRQCNSVINIITITVSQHHSYFNILMYLGQITLLLLGQVKEIGQKWTGISLNFSSESQKCGYQIKFKKRSFFIFGHCYIFVTVTGQELDISSYNVNVNWKTKHLKGHNDSNLISCTTMNINNRHPQISR